MNKTTANKRIDKIVGVIPACKILADVGCDHGFTGIAALQKGLAEQVIFVDISAPSLEKARRNLPDELKNRAKFVCRDGLGDIEADCAVIAGMGGLEIMSVLDGTQTLPDKLVLQPMRNQSDVRKRLLEYGYGFVYDEMFAFADRYYDLIVADKNDGVKCLTESEIIFGAGNMKGRSDVFRQYLQDKKNELEQIMKTTDDENVAARYGAVCAAVESITEELS